MNISLPDPATLVRQVPILPKRSFPAASLGAWLHLARQAGVAYVPAKWEATVEIDGVLGFETPEDPKVAEALSTLDTVNRELAAGHMLRWDCCAGYGVKSAMSEGHRPLQDDVRLVPDDPRAFDLLYTFPSDRIDIFSRPWIGAREENGYPVEFRVFVVDGVVQAVSNYYIQRPLEDSAENKAAAREACLQAARIVEAIKRSDSWPAMPGMTSEHRDELGIHATLDFIVADDGRVLFLEGGPGFGFGAHPCAFLNVDGTVDAIEGIRF